jgi:REP element-mobilizing transposase RayT
VARPLRVEYPGAHYHVINRGNAGGNIFETKKDREKFLDYLGKAVERFSLTIHTYCLMTNHYHLLVETPKANLSAAIQWLSVSYAVYYNRRHQRRGHLFEGRFKALLIEADEYLQGLSRYIHLNPVRAKLVEKPAAYKWSSYPAFIGRTKRPDWLVTRRVQGYFGRKKREAVKNYKLFVEGIDIDSLENPTSRAAGGFILGDADFVQWVKEKFLYIREEEKEIPQLQVLKSEVSLERIIRAVCDEFGCEEDQIREKGRKRHRAREFAIYLSRDLAGISCRDLGVFFGGVSGAAITMKYNQVSREIAQNRKQWGRIKSIKQQILNI